MGKRATKQQLLRFRRDLAALRKIYTNDDLAKKLNVNAANLSSYSTGAKNPGLDFINKFYMIFGDEIPNEENKSEENKFERNDPSPEAEDPLRTYRTRGDQDELIRVLKYNNEHLWVNLGKIVRTNEKMADSQKDLAQSTNRMSKTNALLVERSFAPKVYRPRPASRGAKPDTDN